MIDVTVLDPSADSVAAGSSQHALDLEVSESLVVIRQIEVVDEFEESGIRRSI